jgi:cyclic lactone autoinducer peptide
MKKEGVKMKKFLASLVLFILAFFSWAAVAGACYWYWYQPELPQKPQE